MKMDCYPRFKRSELAKECHLAEVEGRPLPFDMPTEHKPKQHDWKKQKVGSLILSQSQTTPMSQSQTQ